MARPSKYNWEAIQEAYEGGLNKDDIVKKYKLDKKQLNNKIYTGKWEVKGNLKADITEFYDNAHKMAQNVIKLHPENQELVIEKISTLEQDNELMSNNRKIAKLLQSIIVSNRNEINLKNIKTVSSTIKDIESIANPRPETVINNTNAQQTNNEIKVEWE